MRISLRTVVIAGVVVGLLVPMTIGTWYTLNSQRQQLLLESQATHQRATNVLAIGVSKALWDLSPEGAMPLVKSLFADTRIVHAQVLDAKGELFYEERDEVRRLGEVSSLESNVLNGDQVIGKVRIDFSLANAHAQLKERMHDAINLSCLQAASCILILLIVINFRLLRPIDRLKAQAELIARRSLDTTLDWQSNDEIGDLAKSLEITRSSLKELFAELESRNAELGTMNGNLELIVAERTATITLILDHVKSGFLLIDAKQNVLGGYTKSCASLLNTKELAGRTFGDVLGLTADSKSYFAACIEQIFEDIMPEELNLTQMPRRFSIGGRGIAIDGSTVRNSQGQIEKILFTIIDVTALDQIEAENRVNSTMVNIMKNIGAFRDFVVESQERLQHAVQGIANGDDGIVRRELHTLKGNSSAFGLDRIASIIHQIEDQTKISVQSLTDIERSFTEFLSANHSFLKVKFGQAQLAEFAVTDAEISSLISLVERIPAVDPVKVEFASWIEQIRLVKVAELLGPLENYVAKLAADRSKEVEFVVMGGGARVNPERVKFAVHSIIHLIRNGIDHGIESPEDRGNKNQRGRLQLEFVEDADNLVVKVGDDGKGIDAKQVVAKALSIGSISAERAAKLTHQEALSLIYADGLSTAGNVTETSGRGVGMAAVLAAVEEVGGSITITSAPGVGTTFTLTLPRLRNAKLRAVA